MNGKNGFVIVNKPIGITSFDAIRKLRRILKINRVGHVGTLDPFANGVLIIAFGRYTKLFFLFDDIPKEYTATGIFGESRDTDDIDGNVLKVSDEKNILRFDELEYIIKRNFVGDIIQKPPLYSAKRINGRRAYDMARGNEISYDTFNMKSEQVRINDIELLEYDYPIFKIRVSTGKGVYIRAVIRDIGEITGNLAYTKELTRTAIGNYSIKDAVDLENFSSKNILNFFDMFNDFDKKIIESEKLAKQILCGNVKAIENIYISEKYLALIDLNNNLIALIEKNRINERNIYSFINIDLLSDYK